MAREKAVKARSQVVQRCTYKFRLKQLPFNKLKAELWFRELDND